MNIKACLDTGVVSLFYAEDCPLEVKTLMTQIQHQRIDAYIVAPILVEAFSQLCKAKGGIKFAEQSIIGFLNTHPVKLVTLNQSLIIKAGELKCKYRTTLSVVDCMAIAYALNKNISFHTTEKGLATLFPKLEIITYSF